MRRAKDESPDDLRRPGGKDLVESYDLHDIGHAYFVALCEDRGFGVEEWGIDMRYDSGEDGLIYDDKMDFKITKSVGIGAAADVEVAIADVKTKSSPEWMGQFNARHYDDYCEKVEELKLPGFVIMFQVDGDEIVDGFAFQVGVTDDEVLRSDEDSAVGTFPDGNHKAVVKHHRRISIDEFFDRLDAY